MSVFVSKMVFSTEQVFEIWGVPKISKTCSVENTIFDTNTPMSTQPHILLGNPITHALQNSKDHKNPGFGATSTTFNTAPGDFGAQHRHVHAQKNVQDPTFASHENLQDDSTSHSFASHATSSLHSMARTDAYASKFFNILLNIYIYIYNIYIYVCRYKKTFKT